MEGSLSKKNDRMKAHWKCKYLRSEKTALKKSVLNFHNYKWISAAG